MKILSRLFIVLSLFAFSLVTVTRPVYAADCAIGEAVGNCTCRGTIGGGGRCLSQPAPVTAGGGGTSVFGNVEAPPGVAQFNAQVTGDGEQIGLIIFMSSLIRIATIVAGLIVFINFILAGYAYISSDGSTKVNEQVRNQLTFSVLGLVIIVASYTIIAIVSLLLFGKADFILNPTITGPTP